MPYAELTMLFVRSWLLNTTKSKVNFFVPSLKLVCLCLVSDCVPWMLYWWNRVFLHGLQRKYCELVEYWWKTWGSSDDPRKGQRPLSMCAAVPELMAQLGSAAFSTSCSHVYSSSVWVCLTCVLAGNLPPFLPGTAAGSPLKHADVKNFMSVWG